jgi:hypothetical protein
VKFAILAHLSWAIGLHRQKREDEFKWHTRRETVEDVVYDVLSKAKQEQLQREISRIVRREVARIPDIDLQEVARKIDAVLL